MTSPARGVWRVARGGVLASASLLIALIGHVTAGGAVPGMAALLALAWVGGCCVLLADQRRGFLPILTASAAAQVVFHLMFAVGGVPHAAHLGSTTTTTVAVDLPMVGGHAIAAVLTAGLLAYGDSVLWSLFHAFRLVRVPHVVPPRPAVRLAVIRACDEHASRWQDYLAHAHPRRGPPALAVA